MSWRSSRPGFAHRSRNLNGYGPAGAGRVSLDLKDFFFLLRQQLVDLFDVLIGHLLEGATTPLPLAAIVLALCACSLISFFALVRK